MSTTLSPNDYPSALDELSGDEEETVASGIGKSRGRTPASPTPLTSSTSSGSSASRRTKDVYGNSNDITLQYDDQRQHQYHHQQSYSQAQQSAAAAMTAAAAHSTVPMGQHHQHHHYHHNNSYEQVHSEFCMDDVMTAAGHQHHHQHTHFSPSFGGIIGSVDLPHSAFENADSMGAAAAAAVSSVARSAGIELDSLGFMIQQQQLPVGSGGATNHILASATATITAAAVAASTKGIDPSADASVFLAGMAAGAAAAAAASNRGGGGRGGANRGPLIGSSGGADFAGPASDALVQSAQMLSSVGSADLRIAIQALKASAENNSDAAVQLAATKRIRELLSVERDTLEQEVLDRDLMPHLLHFLKQKDHAALQVEALWALTNIAAGTTEHTHLLIKNHAVPTLVALLDSSHDQVLEQTVWVLGNIAGDGPSARDNVIHSGAITGLLRCLDANTTKINEGRGKVSLSRIATWTLSNLCDGQPRPVFQIQSVLTTLKGVLAGQDTEVLSHACWALSHLCDGPSPHINSVVDSLVCGRLVELLGHPSWRVVKPALRTVGNIVCAEDDTDYTQHIIECDAVTWLSQLIVHPNREIQKEACWTLSNIAAGTVDQIQRVLDSKCIPALVTLASASPDTNNFNNINYTGGNLIDNAVAIAATAAVANQGDNTAGVVTDAPFISPESLAITNNSNTNLGDIGGGGSTDPDVKIEACWVLLNATSCGSNSQIERLVRDGCVSVLCDLLSDPSMVMMALEGLERILQVGEEMASRAAEGAALKGQNPGPRINPHAGLINTAKVDALQKHRSTQVAKRATRMWKQHFVLCKICSNAYSLHSAETSFCNECKCNVCRSCDCTQYHLSYQDDYWREQADKETKEMIKKKENNKNKRQKKRAKDRKKRAAAEDNDDVVTAATKEEEEDEEEDDEETHVGVVGGVNDCVVTNDRQNELNHDRKSSGSNRAAVARNGTNANDVRSTIRRKGRVSDVTDGGPGSDHSNSQLLGSAKPPPGEPQSGEAAVTNQNQDPSQRRVLDGIEPDQQQHQQQQQQQQQRQQKKKNHKQQKQKGKEKEPVKSCGVGVGGGGGEEYVDFLMRTKSILELAELMDSELANGREVDDSQ